MPRKSDNSAQLKSNTAILPKEIIDYIMDFHRRDKACLSACTLVCHAWTDSARRHLFRRLKIVIGVRGRSRLPPFRETFRLERTIRPLYHLIRRTPHVQQYIKTLSIRIYYDSWRYESFREIPRDFFESRRVWTWARYLSGILSSLTAIEAFDFANTTKKPFTTRCPPAIMASISCVLRLSSLKYVAIPAGSAHDMFHMLYLCPKIVHLSLGRCFIIETPPRLNVRLPHGPIQLERLDVSFGYPTFLFALDSSIGWPMEQVVRYDRLTHLSLNVMYSNPRAIEDTLSKVADVLRQTKATLTDLSMNTYLSQPLYNLIDMAKLKRFEFSVKPGCSWSTKWLVDSFQHVPDRAVLEQFTLITEEDCHNWGPREVWDVLDDPLAAWGSLKEVRIRTMLSPQRVEGLLPKLTALGKLNQSWFTFDWQSHDRYIDT